MPISSEQHTITLLLGEIREGNEDARNQLFSLMYAKLQEISRSQRQQWWGNETMNTTALSHELYLKLMGSLSLDVQNRAHFCAIAARTIRQILMDYAKKKKTSKRGKDARHVPIEDIGHLLEGEQHNIDLMLTLNELLDGLEQMNPRLAQIAELHYFTGQSHEEIAAILNLSTKTVSRDLKKAKAWFQINLS